MFEGFDGWLRIKDQPGNFADSKSLTVPELLEQLNFTFETEYTDIYVEGEVASFKVNQGKWVFFDLKENDAKIGCFMTLSQLGIALTDGMKVKLCATPSITNWGKLSLTVKSIIPVGEGNVKKSFELLKRKLTAEGLFAQSKKRPLPENLSRIGVISSTAAAGYHDFLKILNERWGGYKISTINTQVQGLPAIEQIIRALNFFNQSNKVNVIVIVRGGGSADDLSVFNDERLVRAIAASRIPVLTGIGHEVDESLADLAADVRASTPTHAAELLAPDRKSALVNLQSTRVQLRRHLDNQISRIIRERQDALQNLTQFLLNRIDTTTSQLQQKSKLLASLSPEQVLRRGYAILSAKNSSKQDNLFFDPGDTIFIATIKQTLTAEVTHAKKRP